MIAIIKEHTLIAKDACNPVIRVIEGEDFTYHLDTVHADSLTEYMRNKSCLVGSEYFKYTETLEDSALVDVLSLTRIGSNPINITAPLVSLTIKTDAGVEVDSVGCVVTHAREQKAKSRDSMRDLDSLRAVGGGE